MPTRRELLKGAGGGALVGLAGSSTGVKAAGAATTSIGAGSSAVASGQALPSSPAFRPGGAGPLYWSTYGYENVTNTLIPEDVWKTNVDWVADDLP